MMTIDDEGEGGCLTNDDVITEIQNFWDFTGNFSIIFRKIYKIRTKCSTFQGNFYLNECYIIFIGIT